MSSEHLFVYGTLRKKMAPTPFIINMLNEFARFVGLGVLQAKMYNIGSYPGVILSDNESDKVTGEVYELLKPNKVLKAFDEYEGCSPGFKQPWEYSREKADIILENGELKSAWVYIYQRPVSGKEKIASGDYLRWYWHE